MGGELADRAVGQDIYPDQPPDQLSLKNEKPDFAKQDPGFFFGTDRHRLALLTGDL